MLGSGDLRLSLGLPPKKFNQPDHPWFLDAVDHLIQVSPKHRKPLMTVLFKANIEKGAWVRSFSVLLTSVDIVSVQRGHRADLQAMQHAIGRPIHGHASAYTNGKLEKVVEKNGEHKNRAIQS